MSEVEIKPRDRLGFTAFVAIALHAAAILGIGFSWNIQQASSPTIEVTLSQYSDTEAPQDADFIAATDQLGSGDADEVVEKTTQSEADFAANIEQEVPQAMLVLPDEEEVVDKEQLTTILDEEFSVNSETSDPADAVDGLNSKTAEELAKEIASLDARLSDETKQNAKGPRIRRLTSVSARRTSDAYYLQSWRRQVEQVGNLNYPEEARQNQLYGDLKLLVTLRPDGTLQAVRVIASSGHKILDDAALRIVRLAAPYPPFPDEMKKSTDLLQIVRSWQFRPSAGT